MFEALPSVSEELGGGRGLTPAECEEGSAPAEIDSDWRLNVIRNGDR